MQVPGTSKYDLFIQLQSSLKCWQVRNLLIGNEEPGLKNKNLKQRGLILSISTAQKAETISLETKRS